MNDKKQNVIKGRFVDWRKTLLNDPDILTKIQESTNENRGDMEGLTEIFLSLLLNSTAIGINRNLCTYYCVTYLGIDKCRNKAGIKHNDVLPPNIDEFIAYNKEHEGAVVLSIHTYDLFEQIGVDEGKTLSLTLRELLNVTMESKEQLIFRLPKMGEENGEVILRFFHCDDIWLKDITQTQ